jgi:class 3 adenylate cyclase
MIANKNIIRNHNSIHIDNRNNSTIEISNIRANEYHNVGTLSTDDHRSLSLGSHCTNAVVIDRYKKRNFFDYFNNYWRVLFSSIIVIATILIWLPLGTRSQEELNLKGSKLQEAIGDERLLHLTYALVAIVIPNALDTVIDLVQFRTVGISWDIHERILFICLTMLPPWILIQYCKNPMMPFIYIALNQSSSVVIMCSINSMISKLEKQKFDHSMYFCTVACIMMACGACCKVHGLFNDKLTSVGITLVSIAYILQFVNFVYWAVEIIYSNLKLRSGSESFKIKQLFNLNIDNIETTVLLYFAVLVFWMIGIFISNYATNSVTWRDTNADNLISFAYLQIVLSLLIIALPMRWFRNEQIVVYETLAELNRNNNSITENPFLLSNDAIQVTGGGVIRSKKNATPSSEQVTVLYVDFKTIASSLENELSVEKALLIIDTVFTIIDYCASLFMHEGLERVETLGFSYLVICGDSKHPEHASIISNFAAVLSKAVNCILHPITKKPIDIRMGVHTGNIILGKVGFLSTRLGLFGEAIEIAIETANSCESGKILCTPDVINSIAETSVGKQARDLADFNMKQRESEESYPTKKFYWIEGPTRSNLSQLFISELIDKCNLIIKTKLSSGGYDEEEIEEEIEIEEEFDV